MIAHDPATTIRRQLAEELGKPDLNTYPPEVFDDFATEYVKMLRNNNGKEEPEFASLANDIDSIRSSYDHLDSAMIFKRKITGFSCDDLKSAMFQAHGKTYPEYFSTSAACLNILAARVNIDPSICKNISGSRKSKINWKCIPQYATQGEMR